MDAALNKAWAQIKWEEDEFNKSSSLIQKKNSNQDRREGGQAHTLFKAWASLKSHVPHTDTFKAQHPEYNLSISLAEVVQVMKDLGNAVMACEDEGSNGSEGYKQVLWF